MTSRDQFAVKSGGIITALAPLLDDRPPPCQSWRGHRFEGRYDKKNDSRFSFEHKDSTASICMLLEASRGGDFYVRDVCVRCGHTIERCKP